MRLNSVIRKKEELERLKEQLEVFSEVNIRAVRYGVERVQGGKLRDDTAAVERIERLEIIKKQLVEKEHEYIKATDNLIKEIQNIKNGKLRILLMRRYILQQTWEEIGEAMRESDRTAKRQHKKALEEWEKLHPGTTVGLIERKNTTKEEKKKPKKKEEKREEKKKPIPKDPEEQKLENIINFFQKRSCEN